MVSERSRSMAMDSPATPNQQGSQDSDQETPVPMMQFATNISIDLSNASTNVQDKFQRGDSGSFQRARQFRGKSRGRGVGRLNGSRLVCQVCGKVGHTKNVCYHRFDPTYGSNNNRQNSTPQGNIAANRIYSR
ncbi:hypothetical protein Ddye_031258 [Dipteronia dyeriana]|uniref:Uncharacterized protein n=1 Tax=Dipteronia dyeriana TaxID=168575 RepID=A0AAD9WME0_9ROSI|nr:hypothetical protein Ddye_031258 [Dipteronia dyeriana]